MGFHGGDDMGFQQWRIRLHLCYVSFVVHCPNVLALNGFFFFCSTARTARRMVVAHGCTRLHKCNP